jgi:hypothetical protein|tara:strand:- start:5025 stop:5255 length:231 start_codon:yes stop_codon:yes gene_type:complete
MKDTRQVREMMTEAKRLRGEWELWANEMREHNKTNPDNQYPRADIAEAVRNYNALRGVVKSLQWVLGMPGVEDPLW